MDSKFYALVALFGALAGYSLATTLSTDWKRRRLWNRIKCLCGKHQPGPVEAASGGRNIQYCDYCMKIVRVYKVTKDQAVKERDIIKRIY